MSGEPERSPEGGHPLEELTPPERPLTPEEAAAAQGGLAGSLPLRGNPGFQWDSGRALEDILIEDVLSGKQP
jgi:hypothetical protein